MAKTNDELMDDFINRAFDFLLLLIIALSFIASGVFIVYQVLEPNANYLLIIGVLSTIGVGLSYFFLKIKSWANEVD